MIDQGYNQPQFNMEMVTCDHSGSKEVKIVPIKRPLGSQMCSRKQLQVSLAL
jgi:hypothetical protein